MGLQGQLSDVSSDSIPVMVLGLIAASIGYLRSFLGLHHPPPNISEGNLILSEQLSLNRLSSHRHVSSGDEPCVVCLRRLRDGDRVRKLHCRHVFHFKCFEGWLLHLNFTCPLCRSPLLSTSHRLPPSLLAFFSPPS